MGSGIRAIFTLLKYKFEKETYIKILTVFLLLLLLSCHSFLIFKNVFDPFLRFNEDNNALYGLAVENWLRFGIFKLKLGMACYWLENLKEKINFYVHHPDLFLLPTFFLSKFFGMSEFITRLSPIIFTFFSILLFFFLVLLWSKDLSLAFFSTFTFATLPATTFYGKMLDHEIFVLFFSLLSLYLLFKFKTNPNEKFIFLLISSLFLGSFSGWHFYFIPALFLIYIFFDKHFPKRRYLLFLIPLIEIVAFSLTLFHFYLLNGKEAFSDLKNAFFVRTSAQPFSLWLDRIFFCLKINFTLPVVFVGFFLIFVFLFESLEKKEISLSLLFFAFPFLVTLVFKQWVLHPYGVFYFLPYFSLSAGKAISEIKKVLEKKSRARSFVLVLILLIFLFYSNLKALSFFDRNLVVDRETIDFLEEIKTKFQPEKICLGRETSGIGYHAIFSFYLKISLLSSPDCQNKIPFAIVFRPTTEKTERNEFLKNEIEQFLKNDYQLIDCRGIICLLKK